MEKLVYVATGTTTLTDTVPVTRTHYPATISVTKTTTTTFTYYTTTAPTTKTIPTSAGFIPVASAKNRTTTATRGQERHRRAVQRRRSRAHLVHTARHVTPAPEVTTSYAYDVICEVPHTEKFEYTTYDFVPITTTISKTTDKTIYSTSTIHTKTTSTVHQSTATVYAACFSGGPNNIHRFDQHPINNIFPFSANYYPGCYLNSQNEADSRAALQSPQDCCHAVFAQNLGFAWFFSGTAGLSADCSCLHTDSAGTSYDWGFNTAESGPVDPTFYVGNGPDGEMPFFAGYGAPYEPFDP